jgi:predicted helicase
MSKAGIFFKDIGDYLSREKKENGIKNDPNDRAKEHANPLYIFDLPLSIIAVSLKTVDIVASLPKVRRKA